MTEVNTAAVLAVIALRMKVTAEIARVKTVLGKMRASNVLLQSAYIMRGANA